MKFITVERLSALTEMYNYSTSYTLHSHTIDDRCCEKNKIKGSNLLSLGLGSRTVEQKEKEAVVSRVIKIGGKVDKR